MPILAIIILKRFFKTDDSKPGKAGHVNESHPTKLIQWQQYADAETGQSKWPAIDEPATGQDGGADGGDPHFQAAEEVEGGTGGPESMHF